MTRSLLARTLLLVLIAAQACMYVPRNKRGGGIQLGATRGHGAETSRDLASGFGLKVVVDKKEPTRLIARDGTSCVVPEKKYESTVPGTSVWCTWFDANR